MIKIKYFLASLTFVLCFVAKGQEIGEELHAELEKLYIASELPGFAVAIINSDSLLFQQSFGYENLAEKKAFSLQTRFNIASVSKPFIGISLMQLVEAGKFELSTPISELLPFEVVNPRFPKTQITIEHLARHTSSIEDFEIGRKSWVVEETLPFGKKQVGKEVYNDFTQWQKNTSTSLGRFLEDALHENGSYFSKKRFSKHRPGEQYKYSNLGAALAAFIVELQTEIPYDKYVENMVGERFGFPKGIWKQALKKLPVTYFQNKVLVPAYRPILYPTGGMMLSMEEISFFLKEMIRGNQGKSDILKPESFKKMMTAKAKGKEGNGIFWELKEQNIGHNGGNYGTLCFMGFNADTGIGRVFLTNMSSYGNGDVLEQAISIWRKLSAFESRL